MRKLLLAIGLVFLVSGNAWALLDDNSTNQDQVQGQAQAAIAVQGQAQGQIGAVTTTTDINTNVPRERVLNRGSLTNSVPQGNEGFTLLTPWGGPAISQGSQMAKIESYYSMIGDDSVLSAEALSWARREAQPKKFLAIPGTSCVCRNAIFGVLCF